MAAGSKRGIGISIVGFVFAIFALVFVITGNIAISIANLGLGMIFFTVGRAAARKATPPSDSRGSQPPAEGGSGRA